MPTIDQTLAILRQMAHDYLDRALDAGAAMYAVPRGAPDYSARVEVCGMAEIDGDAIREAYRRASAGSEPFGDTTTLACDLPRLRADYLARLAAPLPRGIDELRDAVQMYDAINENFADPENGHARSAADLLTLSRMWRASAGTFTPDEWEPRQVEEALRGIAPRWDDAERPVYSERA